MIPVPQTIRRFPWGLIATLVFIAGFGMLVLYSAAAGSFTPWALTHAMRFAMFLSIALLIGYLIPLEFMGRVAFLGYAAVAILLFGVEVMGAVKGGSQRWLNIGFMNLQPSELMKVAIVLALARFYSQLPPGETPTLRALWPALVLIGIPAALVMLQPDLGTALAIVASGVIVMFLAGLPIWWFVSVGVAGAAALPILYGLLHDYQQRRVLIFLNPEDDPLGAGYHITQSKIAIGSGGLDGKGFLNGSQSHLDYLPEGHTDFIFATMAEEWGLLGGLALGLAYYFLLRWSTRVALGAPTRFGKLTAAGLTMTIFFYIAINLMMVMGLAPVVGIPLPLFSHGGSSMMTIMLCVGIIIAIERDKSVGRRPFG
ncbi:MAG: rod shape-determining protein RodA [Sphingopyxis sp.]|nr:rod shape-determining protein RodA [Sphingopyxis sp.]